MCLLALFYRVVEDAPVVVGANREEYYARAGEPPRLLESPCRMVAGIDPTAGGTWLGVNEHGMLAGITNRLKSGMPALPRSRGLLLRDLLACPGVAAAVALAARELGGLRYAGGNILLADAAGAQGIHAGDWLRVRPLPPGFHVLTDHDVNDVSDRRIGHALGWLEQRSYATAEDCLAALKELCAQTGNGSPPICWRGPDRGTVSSTLVALRSSLARSSYLHAQGPPDLTPYVDYSAWLGQLRN